MRSSDARKDPTNLPVSSNNWCWTRWTHYYTITCTITYFLYISPYACMWHIISSVMGPIRDQILYGRWCPAGLAFCYYQRLRLCEVAWLQSFATVASLSRTARHARCLAAVVCVPSGLQLAGKRMLDVDVSPAPAIAGNVQELARGIHVHCKKDPCFNLHNY